VKYEEMAEAARDEIRRGASDEGTPQVRLPAEP
jgi:hypothetical protein